MRLINQVTLVGRMTQEPNLRYTGEGRPVLNVTIAINRHYKNSQGEFEADFVRCIAWGKTAENTSKYCRKGSLIGITGRIQTRQYDDTQGKRVYITEVIADTVKFMDTRPPAQERKQEENVKIEDSALPF